MNARQSGLSIVEALVALVVLSFAMLGIAGMSLESLRANRTAQTRTLAVQLVNDLADRIRANRSGRASYVVARGAVPPAPAKDCAVNDCTPKEVAAYDLNQWYLAVRRGLPTSVGAKPGDRVPPEVQVSYVAGTTSNDPDRYIVLTAWKEPGDASFLTTQVEVFQIGSSTS
jgi:type IV pilus modification protein PilV